MHEHLQLNIKEAGYDKKIILKDIAIDIEENKISTFIGPNGAGKSTLLKAVIGLVKVTDGEIKYLNKNITNREPEINVKDGISFVPQGNRVFGDLTVYENLEIGGYLIKEKKLLKERMAEMLEIFPLLKAKLKNDAGDLSGGEKQQLALARALILKPKLLLLDEPSLGLSPKLVQQAFKIIEDIRKNFGCTIMIVEQKVREVLKIANKVYAIKLGRIVFEGIPTELEEGERLKEIFLI
ncbi:MAG: ABC transporter ATP-binding protein [Ignavibacteriaceae bacterium]